jgi:SAM-dependent methyltransferase
VASEDYTGSFGFQWNRFRQTQLDSHSGLPISRERFFRQTEWSPDEMAGKRVLDVDCGAGRFAEIALSCGAEVVALDYSLAVDACWQNLQDYPGLNVVQGDIYHLPFKPEIFDFVYCFGVLQHTPNVKDAFMALIKSLRTGGRVGVDIYPKLPYNILWPKYWLRLLTRHLPKPLLFKLVEVMVNILLPVSLAIGRIPRVGRKLRYAVPVANYDGIYPLSRSQLKEWSILDTFDMLAPTYDQPKSAETLRHWFAHAELTQIEVFRSGGLVAEFVNNFGTPLDRI